MGPNGPTRAAIQAQALADLSRSRAISAESGIEASDMMRMSHHIRTFSEFSTQTIT